MKKIIAFLLCACLAFSLIACGQSAESKSTSQPVDMPLSVPEDAAEAPLESSEVENPDVNLLENPSSQPAPTPEATPNVTSQVDASKTEAGEDIYPDMTSAQDAVGFTFDAPEFEGLQISEIAVLAKKQYIKVSYTGGTGTFMFYKGSDEDKMPYAGQVNYEVMRGQDLSLMETNTQETLGEFGSVFDRDDSPVADYETSLGFVEDTCVFASWDVTEYQYVLVNHAGLTPEDIEMFMTATV